MYPINPSVEKLPPTARYGADIPERGDSQSTIHNSPRTSLLQVLCIHLKRFRFTSCVRTKLSLPIGFPLSGLDMGQFTVAGGRRGGGGGGGGETNSVYDLAAVVVHHGSG